MTHTLTLCLGMFFGICGQIREFDFQSVAACERERATQLAKVGDGYAVCAPNRAAIAKARGAE